MNCVKILVSVILIVCFARIISESDATTLVSYETDEQFLEELKKWTANNVPVLVTKKHLTDANNSIISYFINRQYPIVIELFVDSHTCPVALSYLISKKAYPSVVMVLSDTKYNDVWCISYSRMKLDEFSRAAEKATVKNQVKVTNVIEQGIKMNSLRVATLIASDKYSAVAETYSAMSARYSQGGPSGKWPNRQSWSPPTFHDVPVTRNLLGNSSPDVEISTAPINWISLRTNIEIKDNNKRIASTTPDYGRSQRARISGQFNSQRTPSQTVEDSKSTWGGDLRLKTESSSAAAGRSQYNEDDPSTWGKDLKIY